MEDSTQVSGTRKLFIGALLLLTIAVGITGLYQRFLKPRADVVQHLTFEFNQGPPNTDCCDLDVIIKVNPNNVPFNAFELYFTYPDDMVEFRNASDLATNITSAYSLITKTVDVASKTVSITGVRTGSTFTGTTPQEIARVTFKIKTSVDEGVANFPWKNETKLGAGLTISKENGTFTIGGRTGARIYFITAKNSYQKGENVDIDVMLDARSNAIKALDLSVTYADYENALTFQNEANLNANFVVNPAAGFDPVSSVGVDPSTKRIYASLVAKSVNLTPTPITGTAIKLGTVKLKVKDTAPDRLVNFLLDDSSTAYNLQTQNVLTEKPTYTIAIGAAATATPACQQKPQGDADCNGSINAVDYDIWQREYLGQIATKTADFDNSGTVDLIDYEIWRQHRP